MKDKVLKIISGGQTGADQGGLKAAKELGIPTGGCAPKGYKTEKGPNMDLMKTYMLHQSSSSSYNPRTEENVSKSDATIIFSAVNSPGSALTENVCKSKGKPFMSVDPYNSNPEEIGSFISGIYEEKGRKIIINVAGNRESKSPGIEETVKDIMLKIFS
jgi:hypothetical protein